MAKSPPAGAAAPVTPVAETVHTDTGAELRVEGTSEGAAALAEAAAVAGAGPGVGAAQIVEELPSGFAARTTKIDEPAGIERTSHVGDRVGTFPRPGDLRTADGVGFVRPVERAVVVRKPGRHDILPLSGPTVDPETIPGQKVAKVAAPQLRRDGRTYLAGDDMVVDFRAHAELTPVGAIVAKLWHDLPDHEG